uniref:Uncharacterized protein n=1 Tax=Rhizophora mucronata TaxID=61149 RepID=A0A2P2QJI4_RHIMU
MLWVSLTRNWPPSILDSCFSFHIHLQQGFQLFWLLGDSYYSDGLKPCCIIQ